MRRILGKLARHLEGVRPVLPPHTREGHASITGELVRLSLPHHASTSRPELQGEFAHPCP